MDPALAAEVDLARAAAQHAAQDEAADEEVGAHVGVRVEAEAAVTHLFEASKPGYRGWRWAVTVASAGPETDVTVSEVVLVPGPDALVAPDWVPWDRRVRAGDLGVGDLLPTSADDARLVPAYVESDDPAVEEVAMEAGLGRARVMTRPARLDAAGRWQHSEFGPRSDMARSAPAHCGTCGFYLPLAGSLRAAFGTCGNEISPADGHVVHAEYGCGAHSEAEVEQVSPVLVANLIYDDTGLDVEPVKPEPAPEAATATEPAPTAEPAPAEPAATEPAATVPASAEPAATVPAPAEPEATEQVATEPAAAEPDPAEPASETEPAAVTEPTPTEPVPADPEATTPAPPADAPEPEAEPVGFATRSLTSDAPEQATQPVGEPTPATEAVEPPPATPPSAEVEQPWTTAAEPEAATLPRPWTPTEARPAPTDTTEPGTDQRTEPEPTLVNESAAIEPWTAHAQTQTADEEPESTTAGAPPVVPAETAADHAREPEATDQPGATGERIESGTDPGVGEPPAAEAAAPLEPAVTAGTSVDVPAEPGTPTVPWTGPEGVTRQEEPSTELELPSTDESQPAADAGQQPTVSDGDHLPSTPAEARSEAAETESDPTEGARPGQEPAEPSGEDRPAASHVDLPEGIGEAQPPDEPPGDTGSTDQPERPEADPAGQPEDANPPGWPPMWRPADG